MKSHLALLCLCLGWTAAQETSVRLNLTAAHNAKAARSGNAAGLVADFDGSGRAYPAEWLPNDASFAYNGVQFDLPPFHDANAPDTVRSDSQVLNVPAAVYHSFHGLAAAVWTPAGFAQANAGNVTFNYDDGSSKIASVVVAPWYSDSPFNGPIHTPWHYSNSTLDYNSTIDHNITHIHYVTTSVPLNDRALVSVELPDSNAFINWFSVTLLASNASQISNSSLQLAIQNVRSTTKWMNNSLSTSGSGSPIQQIEVLLDNLAPQSAPDSTWITSPHSIIINSTKFRTVVPGVVKRLRSHDQALVRVGVVNEDGVAEGSEATGTVTILDNAGKEVLRSEGWSLTAGIPAWSSNDESLATHEAPEWFDDAKFGIFIHWGVYSVPAWAPTGQQYAEWYNWQFHNPPNADSPTWVHHRDTYGPNIIYNDFIANFTAENWNPDNWTDLFANAGAKYFVLVSKHHDGFALFNVSGSSHRNALEMGPKRDLLRDLFDSAKTRHPDMKRGTYFSLPEWFNPAYEPYARTKFPGQPALYAFNHSCCEPYAGYIPVDNFIEQVQTPQLNSLFYNYETDILWCDADGRSAFSGLASDWYNFAAQQGRQVVRNNRCGSNQTDFVTPEYATYSARLSQKWESSAGIDPFSYGYNSDTPPSGYQNASSLLPELIDIVSKGGNFLLDIGPKSDGTIVEEMTTPLLEIGRWLQKSGEAIYSTRPWWVQSASSTPGMADVRFTTTPDAFYIIALERPVNGQLKTDAPIPIREGDVVNLLGGSGNPLSWNTTDDVLAVDVSDEELKSVDFAWAFRIQFT